jgi:hypothetical protein
MSVVVPRRVDGDDSDDAAFASLLREVGGVVPEDAVDWDAFHAQLSARAKLSLARLRHPQLAPALHHERTRPIPIRRVAPPSSRHWWEHTARWSRLTVSSALAASVALVVVIRLTPKDGGESALVASTDDVGATRAAFESAVVGHTHTSTVNTVLMPSATDLLIPLGDGGVQ